MERVPGLVEECLVVVQPALRAHDQMHFLRRVGGDHAGARVLLRPVVEVELDVPLAGEIEAEPREGLEAHRDGALLRVEAGERRHAADVGDVVGRRLGIALLPEDPVEPALPQRRVGVVLPAGGVVERGGEPPEVDLLELGAAGDRIRLLRELGVERLRAHEELEPPLVQECGRVGGELSELLAVGVLVEDRERGLSRPERHRLAVELDPLREGLVFEPVDELRKLEHRDAACAGLLQPEEALSVGHRGCLLGSSERLVLLAREQVRVPADHGRELARLLGADSHGTSLLRRLVEIAGESLLESVRRQRRHRIIKSPVVRAASRPDATSVAP